ncbi:DinB family protein [Solitalea sp. MAHUQ-68]|uniref:DinB family protein n=1 Tax=Solitalea agri TaxID=2953739 RepID=A0A9X2F2N0_9SPHI|nr:DinB family protein [Solitalea agri]MCO4293091.1 DinB family protein [Solitalea agri]
MNVTQLLNDLQLALEEYLSRLDHYSDQVFMLQPEVDSWSMAQVYSHVLGTCLMQHKALEICMQGQGLTDTPGLNEMGEKLFALGHFPPGKYQAPEIVKSRVQNIHKEDAKALAAKLLSRIKAIQSAEVLTADENQRLEHPRLGFLNATQWIHFMLIHSNHHLQQLDRIERKFSMC